MLQWLRALSSQTAVNVWFFISAFSTVATFFVPSLSGKPRLVSGVSTLFGFLWANYKLYANQQGRIRGLELKVETLEARKSELKITPEQGRSRFILNPLNGTPNADFRGGHFEFHLMVENTGRRNSIINKYEIELLGKKYSDLKPLERVNSVQGRHCIQGLHGGGISRTGLINVNAESVTESGTLLFHLPDLNLDQFVNAGMTMHGPRRQLGDLTCRLTLTDTTGTSVSEQFQMREE